MPEKLHRCVDDIEGNVDNPWAVCNASIKECEVCNGGEHEPNDHPYIPKFQEHHNPLDIPFGHEVTEVNMNPKDVEEGGMGSGRNPEGPDDLGGGGAPGPLISFGEVGPLSRAPYIGLQETIIKQLLDVKLSCPCNKNK